MEWKHGHTQRAHTFFEQARRACPGTSQIRTLGRMMDTGGSIGGLIDGGRADEAENLAKEALFLDLDKAALRDLLQRLLAVAGDNDRQHP